MRGGRGIPSAVGSAGCKGVVIGPSRDILSITHGPIGCSFYSWLTRRNQTRPHSLEDPNYINYCLSTDMQEENIVFGGEKKLKAAVKEAYELFKARAIAIFSTCPVGLIGDDVHAVAREMKAELGINVFGFSCEGYRGVSQSAGHHIANNGVFKNVVGLNNTEHEEKFKINLLGEYNIGGDGFVLEDILSRCGIKQVSTFSGNSTYDTMANAHICGPEPDHVPPLDQLRGRDDGEALRNSVDEGELHRRRGFGQIATPPRSVLRGWTG